MQFLLVKSLSFFLIFIKVIFSYRKFEGKIQGKENKEEK